MSFPLLLGQTGSETLADAGNAARDAGDRFLGGVLDHMDILFHPTEVIDALSALPVIGACVVVVVGALCVLNGYQWHKWVIAILAFILGVGVGYRLSQEVGRSTIVATSIGCLCAIIATPLLRITVAIFGGLTGAFIGANAWTAFDANPPDAHWAGALVGFAIVAMASIVLFRVVIVLFTSVGGAAMVVLGSITLLLRVPAWETAVNTSLLENNTVIPLLIAVAAVSGFVLQESRLRQSGISIMAKEQVE